MLLCKDCPNGASAGIGLHSSRELRVVDPKNWSFAAQAYQGVEPLLLGGAPLEGCILPGKLRQGLRNLGVSFNELSIVVRKAQELLNVGDVLRDWPVLDGFNLVQIDADLSWLNDAAEELDRLYVELALLWFEFQLVLLESSQDFLHLLGMLLQRVRVDKDIVEVSYDEDV